MFLILYLTKFY